MLQFSSLLLEKGSPQYHLAVYPKGTLPIHAFGSNPVLLKLLFLQAPPIPNHAVDSFQAITNRHAIVLLCIGTREGTDSLAVRTGPGWTFCDNGKFNEAPELTSFPIVGGADPNGINADPGEFTTLSEFEIDDEVCGLECNFDEVALENVEKE